MKQKLSLFLTLALVLCMFSACTSESVHTETEYYTAGDNQAVYTLENDTLKLEMDGATSYFTLTDKRSGRVWHSVPEGASEDASAASATRNAMLSPLVLTYTDRTGNDTIYDGYTYSVKEGTFQITQEADTLRVDYMIGPNAQVYCIPQVISDSRMERFLSGMSKEEQGIVRKNYLHYDLSGMSDKNREKLLPLLPELEDGPLYALSSVTGGSALQDYQLAQLEEIFLAAGYTEEDRKADQAQTDADTGSDVPQYNLTLFYSLDSDSLQVQAPESLMRYPADYPIKSLQLLPYFCAGSTKDDGWLLVPDGGGAQISLNNGKTLQAPYYSSLYGWDEAVERDTRVQETDSCFPVFGIMKNGAYLMAVGEGGNAELSVEADVSGKGSSYNYVHAVYSIVHGVATTISEKSNDSVWIFQSTPPSETISLRYICGNSDSYVDMAERYRELLFGGDSRSPLKAQTLPLVLDFVGALDLTQSSFGVPAQAVTAAADYSEVLSAVQKLPQTDSLMVRYSGILNGGLSQTALLKADTEKVLGSKSEKEALISAVHRQGGRIYLQGYTEEVFDTAAFDNFSPSADAIRNTVNEVVEQYFFQQDSQCAMENEGSIYLLNHAAAEKAVDTLAAAAQNWCADGIALADYGDILYSDFNRSAGVSRDISLRAQQQKLLALQQAGTGVITSGGNDYAAAASDCITEMDFQGGEYDILDAHIPFYQIALHGYVPYTGAPLNMADDYETAVLNAVEYGAGLSYRFFEMDYTDLTDSPYTYNYKLFSANFSDWQETLTALYQRMDEEFGHTACLTITDHRRITAQVSCTEYSDGTRVYVNYGQQPAAAENVTIPARDWLTVKGDG